MRAAAILMAVPAVLAVCCLGADSSLSDGLLAAKTAEERAALVRGHEPKELGEALAEIEKAAGAAFDTKNYPVALNGYEAALLLARETGAPAKVPFYFRRMGISHALLGQNDAALASYRDGTAAAEAAGDEVMLAENLHGTANILQRVGRYREALPFCERELALTEKAGVPEPLIRALNTYGETLIELGRIREALPLQSRAVELSRHSTRPGDYGINLGNLAIDYLALGDAETALRLLRSLPPTPAGLDSIARAEGSLHHEAEAETAYRDAIATSTDPGQWRVHAVALADLAVLQQHQGKLSAARASAEEALALFLGHKDASDAAAALSELSRIAIDEKDAAQAMQQAEEAVRMARESESPEIIIGALVAEARALEASGRQEEARQSFLEAISIAESQRADAPASAAGLQGELSGWMPAYQYAVSHEIRSGNALTALSLSDRAKARVLLDMLDGGEPGFDAIADPLERAREQQVRDEVSRARLSTIAKPTPSSKAVLEAALRKEDEFDLGLYARHPELVLQRAAPREIRAEDLASLTPDRRTALLSYFVLPDSVVLFVVRSGEQPGVPSVKVFTLSGGDKLDALIRSFRAQIAARDLDYRVSASALYRALLAPAVSALRGADRWVLSPDGALWDVPFQALMDPQGRHLIETISLSYAPSLSVLRQLREKPAASGSPRLELLAVANPAMEGVAAIPEAEREASAIAALYSSDRSSGRAAVLAGIRARASLFRENAGEARVIHIASHAETEANHPLESFLLFTPDKPAGASYAGGANGAITARDLLGMRLRADLVVLSACETARGKIGQGDGVMGLGWAALAAGARASVLSQWKVDSGATSDLMIGFHRRLTGSKAASKADALRQASLDVMRSPGRAHPFYWAGFIVLGDAR